MAKRGRKKSFVLAPASTAKSPAFQPKRPVGRPRKEKPKLLEIPEEIPPELAETPMIKEIYFHKLMKVKDSPGKVWLNFPSLKAPRTKYLFKRPGENASEYGEYEEWLQKKLNPEEKDPFDIDWIEGWSVRKPASKEIKELQRTLDKFYENPKRTPEDKVKVRISETPLFETTLAGILRSDYGMDEKLIPKYVELSPKEIKDIIKYDKAMRNLDEDRLKKKSTIFSMPAKYVDEKGVERLMTPEDKYSVELKERTGDIENMQKEMDKLETQSKELKKDAELVREKLITPVIKSAKTIAGTVALAAVAAGAAAMAPEGLSASESMAWGADFVKGKSAKQAAGDLFALRQINQTLPKEINRADRAEITDRLIKKKISPSQFMEAYESLSSLPPEDRVAQAEELAANKKWQFGGELEKTKQIYDNLEYFETPERERLKDAEQLVKYKVNVSEMRKVYDELPTDLPRQVRYQQAFDLSKEKMGAAEFNDFYARMPDDMAEEERARQAAIVAVAKVNPENFSGILQELKKAKLDQPSEILAGYAGELAAHNVGPNDIIAVRKLTDKIEGFHNLNQTDQLDSIVELATLKVKPGKTSKFARKQTIIENKALKHLADLFAAKRGSEGLSKEEKQEVAKEMEELFKKKK